MKLIEKFKSLFSKNSDLPVDFEEESIEEFEIETKKQSALSLFIEKHFPSMAAHTTLIIYAIVLLICTIIIMYTTSSLAMAYHDKQATESKITEMQSFLVDWQKKSNLVNKAPARPVKNEQMEKVQSAILVNLNVHSLSLLSLKESNTGQKETNGRKYTLEFTGDYINTISFISNFKAYDALIAVKHLKMQTKNGTIQTILTYKVYTK